MQQAFEVERADLQRTRLIETPTIALGSSQVRMRIDHFALTANNITYAVFGDAMQYWNFFPAAADDGSDGIEWGRIPVWGFAEIVESNHDDVSVGSRFYGYFPIADELIVEPGRVEPTGFTDMATHRQAMAGAYNRYVSCAHDPAYCAEREPQQMVLWPLFYTSFMIDDVLADNSMFGCSTVVISSASAKTAIGAAWLLSQHADIEVVGLTSNANANFVEELGCYHDVVTYDSIGALHDADAVYIDIAGSAEVTAAVHHRFGDRLGYSMIVGASHWSEGGAPAEPLPGPTPQFFFAPTQIAKRNADWGGDELQARVTDAWRRFSEWTDAWLHIESSVGPAEVERTYRRLLGGNVDPRAGAVCSLV
jgi:Protein of unknown function (DUF2855)